MNNNSYFSLYIRRALLAYIFTCAVSAYLGGPIIYALIVLYSLYFVLWKDNSIKYINGLCLGIFIVALMSIVINYGDIESVFRPIERIITLLIVMVAFSPIINSFPIYLFRKTMFIYFSVGLFFVAIASAILAFSGFGYVKGSLLGLSNWPNSLGYALGISTITMLVCLNKEKYWISLICLLVIGLCVFTIPKTGTRTSLYSLPIILILYTSLNSKSLTSLIRNLILMLAAVACFLVFVKLDMSRIELKNEIARESGQNSREQLFETRIKEFKTSPIIGIGTFGCLSLFHKVNDNGNVEAGNSFLMFLSMNGIIGFIVFTYFYIRTILRFIIYMWKKQKLWEKTKYKLSSFEQYLCLVLTFNFIYMLQAGALLNPGFYITGFNWLSLSMAYMYPRYDKFKLVLRKNG